MIMTVKELRELLLDIPDHFQVIQSTDEEGNYYFNTYSIQPCKCEKAMDFQLEPEFFSDKDETVPLKIEECNTIIIT